MLSLLCLRTVPLSAQLLASAATSGRGAHSVFLSGAWQRDGGFGVMSPSVTYVRGLHDRADLYLSAGRGSSGRDHQAWGGIGGNVQLRNFGGVDTSFYAVGTFPLERRAQACTLLLNPAFIASRALNARFTLYAGVAALVPIGHRADDVFTPGDDQLNVPLGLGVVVGGLTLYGEVDFARQPVVGIGIERSLPRR